MAVVDPLAEMDRIRNCMKGTVPLSLALPGCTTLHCKTLYGSQPQACPSSAALELSDWAVSVQSFSTTDRGQVQQMPFYMLGVHISDSHAGVAPTHGRERSARGPLRWKAARQCIAVQPHGLQVWPVPLGAPVGGQCAAQLVAVQVHAPASTPTAFGMHPWAP